MAIALIGLIDRKMYFSTLTSLHLSVFVARAVTCQVLDSMKLAINGGNSH